MLYNSTSFTLPDGFIGVPDLVTPLVDGEYTLELLYLEEWLDLGAMDPNGVIVLGDPPNDSLIDEVKIFRATFATEGIYSTTVEVWTVTEDYTEKDVLLYSKFISAVVVPAPEE